MLNIGVILLHFLLWLFCEIFQHPVEITRKLMAIMEIFFTHIDFNYQIFEAPETGIEKKNYLASISQYLCTDNDRKI